MRTSYARQHCQSSSADIPATYVREYTTYREAETLQLAIELVLSTVKYLQRAHACTCTYVRTLRSAARCARGRTYALRVQICVRRVHGTRVGHACDTRATHTGHAWDTRALVKLPLGGTVQGSLRFPLYIVLGIIL